VIVGRLEHAADYLGIAPRLAAAFRALREGGCAAWTPGRRDLDGDRLYALVQEYRTKPRTAGRLEAHRKYIDVQFVAEGAETVGWAPIEGLRETEPYDPARDVAFFAGAGEPVTLRAGMFAVFFPHDGHAPGLGLAAAGGDAVRKIVVKVAVAD
jgi:YhcH/YjgK/YiaL family protein